MQASGRNDVIARLNWTDHEIEGLARDSADRAKALIGDWLLANPDEHEIEWIPSRWVGRVDIGILPEPLRCEGRIKRRDLFDLADQVTEGSRDRTVAALLIGVLAWGSGNGVRRGGFSDGDPRGPWRAQQALSLPNSAEAITRIRRAVAITRRDGGQAAYDVLSPGGCAKLAAMGESFFTKLIYVSGHRAATTPRPLPLILDTNVRKALVRKGGILEDDRWTLYRTPLAYRQYLLIAQTWATLWKVQPHQVEYGLFQLGKDL
jgi:hypothetical protein